MPVASFRRHLSFQGPPTIQHRFQPGGNCLFSQKSAKEDFIVTINRSNVDDFRVKGMLQGVSLCSIWPVFVSVRVRLLVDWSYYFQQWWCNLDPYHFPFKLVFIPFQKEYFTTMLTNQLLQISWRILIHPFSLVDFHPLVPHVFLSPLSSWIFWIISSSLWCSLSHPPANRNIAATRMMIDTIHHFPNSTFHSHKSCRVVINLKSVRPVEYPKPGKHLKQCTKSTQDEMISIMRLN